MSDEKKVWVDRLFGTGVIWSLLMFVIAAVGLYRAYVGGAEDLDKLRQDFNQQFKNANDGLESLKNRTVKLENSQAVAKAEAWRATVQANVAQLQLRYQKPEEQTLLRDFGAQFGHQQRNWLQMLDEHPTDPAAITPPPPQTLPDNLKFLQNNDKDHLGSLLDNTNKTWAPPPSVPAIPSIDWASLQQPNIEDKSFPEKVWETVEAYPVIAVLLVVVVLGALLNKK